MQHNRQFYLRRLHRYLGVILGLQFLCWTVGGLYFSWTDIDEVHGDFQRAPAPLLAPDAAGWVSPSVVLANLQASGKQPDSIVACRLVPVLDEPCWQIVYLERSAQHRHPKQVQLASAKTGQLRPPLTKAEAVEVASRQFAGRPPVLSVRYLDAAPGGHEYRGNALPAWAVVFDHPSRTTVYVAAEHGTVEKFRNEKWRIFDWLWMLHIMDYDQRDDIGNGLLRLFSVLGLLTIASGFTLFVITSPFLRKFFYPKN